MSVFTTGVRCWPCRRRRCQHTPAAVADAGPVLPAAFLLVLPELPVAPRALPAERLWDVAPPGVVLLERETPEVRLGGTFRAAIRTHG